MDSLLNPVNLSVIARLVSYGVTCAALLVFRRNRHAPAASFRVPAGAAVAIVTLALIAWLLSNSTWRDARDSAIAAAIGLAIYASFRFRARARPPGGTPGERRLDLTHADV